ncbi:MAG TPA: bilirubin oxidase, partial [Nitrosomonas sp.]|nr:bilirubin oxidase [Nitrosomonas sp.]
MKTAEQTDRHGESIDVTPHQSRRTFLKITGTAMLAAPAVLTSRKSRAQVLTELPPSPPTRPWLDELPSVIEPLSQTDLLNGPLPPPQGEANIANGECGRTGHQRWNEFFGTPVIQPDQADLYELKASAHTDHVFHPDYPPQLCWSFEGRSSSGALLYNPTIFARYGRQVIIRLHNGLPPNHGAEGTQLTSFGLPEISMHLHNLHVPSESDGFPGDYFSETKYGPTLNKEGKFKDHFYPNVYAGLDEFGGIGDQREGLGTLWYHDHTLDSTAPNAQRGLAGFYLLYDDLDSGDEYDTNRSALRLPSHPYDYPLKFQDLHFDANGIHVFDQLNPEGTLGDKIAINGKIQPVLRVARRKYRLRLLNAGSSRFYELYLVN